MSEPAQNSFPQISECSHIVDADHALLRELRDVLDRHQAVNRFGIHLLHRHFDLRDDEIMVETGDISNRSLRLEPKAVTADIQFATPTQWHFVADDRIVEPTQVCFGFGHNQS